MLSNTTDKHYDESDDSVLMHHVLMFNLIHLLKTQNSLNDTMRKKKKMLIKGTAPKPRNPIARIMCTDSRFKTRAFKNKKKDLKKFDWHKELD